MSELKPYSFCDDESISAWTTRATCGTITAEQVEDAIYSHCKFYEGGDVDAQAIADELNATLGESKRAVCSECGTLLSDYILCTLCAEKFAVKR